MATCHLHEVIEQLDLNQMHATALCASNSAVPAALNWATRLSSDAMCFYMGQDTGLDGLQCIPELLRLPFPTCWFEFDHVNADGIHRFGILAHADDTENIWFVFCRPQGTRQWQLWGWASLSGMTGREITWSIKPKEISEYAPAMLENLHLVWAFLSAMNCSNVKRVQHDPEPKLQKARTKRGKRPLFSFWTLELEFDRSSGVNQTGGTHASPRLHLRRGHARQYKPGEWTWVQPHAVGNKKLGMVHKNYAVRDEPYGVPA